MIFQESHHPNTICTDKDFGEIVPEGSPATFSD